MMMVILTLGTPLARGKWKTRWLDWWLSLSLVINPTVDLGRFFRVDSRHRDSRCCRHISPQPQLESTIMIYNVVKTVSSTTHLRMANIQPMVIWGMVLFNHILHLPQMTEMWWAVNSHYIGFPSFQMCQVRTSRSWISSWCRWCLCLVPSSEKYDRGFIYEDSNLPRNILKKTYEKNKSLWTLWRSLS